MEAAQAATDRSHRFEDSMDLIGEVFQVFDDNIRESLTSILSQIDTAMHMQLEELLSCKIALQKPISISEMEIIRRRDIYKHTFQSWNQAKRKNVQIPHIQNALFLVKFQPMLTKSFLLGSRVELSISYQPIKYIQLPLDEKDILYHVRNGLFPIVRDPTTIVEPLLKLDRVPNPEESSSACSSLWGFAIHPMTGNVFISVEHSHCILELNTKLEVIRCHRNFGDECGKLNQPRGISFSPDGKRFVVVDNSNNRILLFDQDINFLKMCSLNEAKKLSYPQNVAFDKQGDFYIAGGASNAVFKFDYDGNHVWTFNDRNVNPHLDWTWGIAVSDDNEIYASCSGNILHVISAEGVFLRHVRVSFSLSNFDNIIRGPNGSLVVSCHNGDKVYFINPDGSVIHSIILKKPSGAGFSSNQQFFVLSYPGEMFGF